MPRRNDLKRILVIGAGPIVIGQACEFDYSGTQACKALTSEGLEVVLVNSNPATIMTDPDMADRTYVEPLTVEVLDAIIAREKPDALLPTVGGQTALNLAVDLAQAGVLEKYKVELIGASIQAIKVAEDRQLFKDAMREIGLEVPQSGLARNPPEAIELGRTLGFPLVIRPSFTLGGVGGGIAYNVEEFRDLAGRGLELSPVHEVLVEESVIGWKEFELEVMRDVADNFVVVCSIENIDPMGVHTGDSITVAPILTLTDKEYQRMRDAARRIIRRVGVETGGSNIQFAVNPANGRMIVIEMKSVGDAMAICRTFKEAFLKGVRSLELGKSGLLFAAADAEKGGESEDEVSLRKRLSVPSDRRMWDLFRALDRGWSVDTIHD